MARSAYIYIVVTSGGRPMGTFTVKHECKTWLERMNHTGLSVQRWHDGHRTALVETLTAEEFME